MAKTTKTKPPNPIDKHVGSRLRMRRKMLNMSQTKLGEALRVSFQQVQKYENGVNRIGASRLQQLSQILEVPVRFFFEGAPIKARATEAHEEKRDEKHEAYHVKILSADQSLSLLKAFMRIKNGNMRRVIVDLVTHIADG